MPKGRRIALALLLLGAVTLAAGCGRGREAAGSDLQGLQNEVRTLSQQQQELVSAIRTLTEEVRRLQGGGGTPAGTLSGGGSPGKPVNRVNPKYPKGVAGQPEWGYHQQTRADLDGDGVEETLVVIARVPRPPAGQPFAWDDGQPWDVYVQEPDGTRTYLFADYVQLGTLDVAVTDGGGVLILERTGAARVLYRADYKGPGKFQMVELINLPVQRTLEPEGAGGAG